MKKIRIIFIIALTVLVLAACGKADKPVEETFTPIDIEEKVPEVDPNTILGTWTYVPEDKNIFYRLIFDKDGTVEYQAGWLPDNIADAYNGTYSIVGNIIKITLAYISGDYSKPIYTNLTIEPSKGELTIALADGTPLFGEELNNSFTWLNNKKLAELLAQKQAEAEAEIQNWLPLDNITNISSAIIGIWGCRLYPQQDRILLFNDGWIATDDIMGNLEFNKDGGISYSIGAPGTDMGGWYYGTYTLKGNEVTLHLTSEEQLWGDEEKDSDFVPHIINTTLKLEPGKDSLRITLINGDSLFDKKPGESFVLVWEEDFWSLGNQWLPSD